MSESVGSQFLGYEYVNKVLQQRVFATSSNLNFGKYIGSEGLGLILGQTVGDGNEMTFANGTPNATSMALWHVGLMGLARDVSVVFKGEGNLKDTELNDGFLKAIKKVAMWPSAEARNEKTLLELWISVMSYDAPESEFKVWAEYFLSAEFEKAEPSQVIEGMLSTMLMNPYFLLRK